jgi:uncharacterized protein (DUF697 family)
METNQNETKKQQADAIISRHIYWSVGAGLIPFPLLDIAAVTSIQLDMLKSLCGLYGVDYSKEQGKSWISALAGSTLSNVIARLGASAIKAVPVIGTVVGITSVAILSGAATYAIGQVFAEHFEKGGSLVTFNAADMKKFYKDKMEEGKTIAANLKEKYKSAVNSKSGKAMEKNTTEKLKELDKLKNTELITEDEYVKMRNDILKSFLDNDI